jgi:hypothetical protein
LSFWLEGNVGQPTDMVEYLSTEKPIHTQEKRVDDFHRAFGYMRGLQ